MSTESGNDLTRFLVLFEGRSGSTYLIESLATHPQIRAEKEMFASIKEKTERESAASAEQLRCLQAFFASGPYDYRAVGFKTKIKDILDRDKIAGALQQFGTRIILLQRRNRIKLLVSLLNAMQLNEATGDWNLYRESDRQPKLQIDVAEFKQWLDVTEQSNLDLNQYAEQLGLPILRLFYEEILTADGPTFERVCDFLGVPYQALNGNCIKHTSDDLREVVQNLDELKGEFIGTRYEPMFEEVLHSPS